MTGPAHPRGWTLTRQLVTGVLVLFVLLTAITGTTTVLVMRHQLVVQIDEQLQQQARLEQGRPPPGGEGGRDVGPCERPGPGDGQGSLRVCRDGDGGAEGFVVVDLEAVALTGDQLADVDAAGVGPSPQTVSVSGLGDYRVVSGRTRDGATVLTALPLEPATDATRRLLVVVGLTSLGGLALVVVAGPLLVRDRLAPLTRVAATADRVSRLPLDSGEVALAERLPDTDPGTEVGQVGHAINSMLDNVAGALAARQASEQRVRRFVADASHELRTPLASIRGYAELSRRETAPVPESVRRGLDRVESEALRMQGLVEDLLLLARLDDGRPLEREPVDLTDLSVTAVGDLHASAPDHRWLLDLPDEPVEVVGDRDRLTQVVVNLLANARTHTPPGTNVTTALRREADGVVLSVTDDGPGVPAELQGEVFQRFTRGDDARVRSAGSTGLGLSIVESVVAAHGGRVSLDSMPGRTTFAVHLPT